MRLPKPDAPMHDWTDEELEAMVLFRRDELKREWCGTFIMQDLDALYAEQDRRAFAYFA